MSTRCHSRKSHPLDWAALTRFVRFLAREGGPLGQRFRSGGAGAELSGRQRHDPIETAGRGDSSLTTSFSLPRAREARAATRPIPPELQPASSSRRSVSAVAPTPYLAELPRRRHLTIAADLTGGRSIVPPRTGLGEKELATSVGSRSAAPTPGAGRSAAEFSVSAVACPMRRLFAGGTERPTRGQRSPR